MKSNVRTICAVVSLGIAGIAAACSDSNKDTPSNDIIVGDGGESSSASGGKASRAGATGSGGDTAASGGTSTMGTAGAATTGAGGASAGTAGSTSIAGATGVAGATGDCEDAVKKCYKCAPTTNAQILTTCTDVTCVPFDNSTLNKMVNGALPALP